MNRLESEIYFPLSKAFPITRDYKECLLPETHPWFTQAASLLKELYGLIHNNTLNEKEYEIYGFLPIKYEHSKELIISKKGLPFILKMNFNRFMPKEATIYRVLLGRRCKDFVEKKQLDRIYIPEKFLIPHNFIKGTGKEICGLNHAVIAEKILFAASNTKKVWKNLSQDVRERQKMQVSYLISKLGYADSHNENIRLAEDGRFTIIDFDEPKRYGFNYFLKLKNSTLEDLKELRIEEFERSEAGLNKFFLGINRTKCDEETNEACWKKSIYRLVREAKKNKLHCKCQSIMTRKSNVSNSVRIENLKERAFFICLQHCQAKMDQFNKSLIFTNGRLI